jgi:hypothetical protein
MFYGAIRRRFDGQRAPRDAGFRRTLNIGSMAPGGTEIQQLLRSARLKPVELDRDRTDLSMVCPEIVITWALLCRIRWKPDTSIFISSTRAKPRVPDEFCASLSRRNLGYIVNRCC